MNQPTSATETILMDKHLNLTSAKLLIIDSNSTSRQTVASILKLQGYTVLEAANGEEAITMSIAGQPDLILLDTSLEGTIDGFETCQRLKETPKTTEIPVIFLTDQAKMQSILRGFSAGSSDYIVKPFNPVEALARIGSHLQVRLLLKSQRKLIGALEQANKSKARMIGVASHDLRGPLGSMRELTHLMIDGTIGEFEEPQIDIIKTINQGCDSMLGLVTNLLDIAILENDTIELKREAIDLEELIQAAWQLQKVNADKKDIELNFESHGLIAPCFADKRQIRRVIDNLISNAIKYAPPDSKALIKLSSSHQQITFSVEDEGSGIPEDELPNLFQEFTTTSVKPTGGEMSTGLGLSICKRIVEAHSGKIKMENRATGGCRCIVSLPHQQQSVSEESSAVARTSNPNYSSYDQKCGIEPRARNQSGILS